MMSIQLYAGQSVRVGNTEYRISSVVDDKVGVELVSFGSRDDTVAIHRRAGQLTMSVQTLLKKTSAVLRHLDGY